MAFTLFLPRVQTAKIWESLGPNESKLAARLQALFDRGMVQQYESEKAEMEQKGFNFRLTDGRICQIFDEGRTIQVPIKFQVKLSTITWYFDAPKDETHQDFRNEVYGSAALGHKKVDNHCEKYWRGTNSLHVKKMHTNENESGLNHNHHRMKKDVYVDPKAVYQHLMGFVETQRELKLFDGEKEKYLTLEEALQISEAYNIYWVRMTHVGPAKTVKMGNKKIELPERQEALLTEYKRAQEKKLTPEDKIEWEENKHKELPCTSINNWESLTVQDRLVAIAEGMSGLGSELAHTRQLEGSKYPTIRTVVAMGHPIRAKL
jgi:hypothetical protein